MDRHHPPLTSGAYLSLRTDGANVLFDDIAVSDVVKYYIIPAGDYAGGTRVAMRKAGAVSYLFGDHLGSTPGRSERGRSGGGKPYRPLEAAAASPPRG